MCDVAGAVAKVSGTVAKVQPTNWHGRQNAHRLFNNKWHGRQMQNATDKLARSPKCAPALQQQVARSPKCPQPHFLQTELLGRVILLNNFGSFIEGEKDRLRCVRALSRVLVHLNVRCGRCHRQSVTRRQQKQLQRKISQTWAWSLHAAHFSHRMVKDQDLVLSRLRTFQHWNQSLQLGTDASGGWFVSGYVRLLQSQYESKAREMC